MKKQIGIIIAIAVAVIIVSIGKDLIIKTAVEKGVELVTGLKLTIGGFRAGILNSVIDIRKLDLHNPAGFKDPLMADVPEVYVAYDLPAIIKGNIHLKEVRLDLKEFVVVKNEKGVLNLDSLKVVQDEKRGRKEATEQKEFRIDSLSLKIGRVVYKDYSRGSSPFVQEFDLNINEKFSNLTDPYSAVSVVVVRALMNTSIARLANFDIQGLSGTISDTLSSAQEMTGQAVATAQQTVKTVTSTTGQAKEAVEQTANAVKDLFNNPFGSKK